MQIYGPQEASLIWDDEQSKSLYMVHPDLGFTKVNGKIARVEIYNLPERLPN